ncbi:hypothetical protein EVAR_93563_1 [Eumeta japonica]|uniref:Uncharacterized protein n=1 Tax=Eumeta variegata TaxID=151549 RepID=A0A4C1UR46_EUMVA|nr:hypothetical protein EVAR_93563_1 [Eumeta japonica]
MTSTPFTVGLNEGRMSSRVLRPPGGGHTDIFGGEPEPPQAGSRRRQFPQQDQSQAAAPVETAQKQEKPTNGTDTSPQVENVQIVNEPSKPAESQKEVHSPKEQEKPKEDLRQEPARRGRVPPVFLLIYAAIPKVINSSFSDVRVMEGGRRVSSSQVLAKMFGRHRVPRSPQSARHSSTTDLIHNVANTISVVSVATSIHEEELKEKYAPEACPSVSMSTQYSQMGSSIDLRYGGQYLTPDQLPQFCDQLHHLVSVVRNIQSYGRTTGEYPRELERRLDLEAREVASVLAEARNAWMAVERARAQRGALQEEKQHAISQLSSLRETEFCFSVASAEVRELETTVRLTDRKLYKNWESIRDVDDPTACDPLLHEIKNKRTALDSVARLIDVKRAQLVGGRPPPTPSPQRRSTPFVAVTPNTDEDEYRQPDGRRPAYKRRKRDREARSVPLSNQPSSFGHRPVSIMEESECTTDNTDSVALPSSAPATFAPPPPPPPPLPNMREILFFTRNMLCAAAVSLLLGRIARWSGREIARSALSLTRSKPFRPLNNIKTS